MSKVFSLSDYADVCHAAEVAAMEAEHLKQKKDEMTGAIIDAALSESAHGMTARQLSRVAEGAISATEIASYIGRHYQYRAKQERVVTHYRETDEAGNMLPGGRVYHRMNKVNVYRMG